MEREIGFENLVGFPSGQRDQTVNLTAMPSKVRILLPPPFLESGPVKIGRLSELRERYAGMVQW